MDTKKLTAAQGRVYNTIKQHPGIRFGRPGREGQIARRLQAAGVIYWSDDKHGWFVVEQHANERNEQ